MDKNFINIYNYLINYTRNEQLYSSLNRNDNFSDRLTLFLLHFAFFLKNFKNEENKEVLQKIYDFNFRQLELSIREIGYGDQSINKKMKVYINLFHSMVSEIHFWDDLDREKKIEKLSIFLEDFNIDIQVVNVRLGPVVTLFEILPAAGIKINTIINLADDISRSMGVGAVRISQIYGTQYLGVEVPNDQRETVTIKELLSNENFKNTNALFIKLKEFE